jgi:hypothetical protein
MLFVNSNPLAFVEHQVNNRVFLSQGKFNQAHVEKIRKKKKISPNWSILIDKAELITKMFFFPKRVSFGIRPWFLRSLSIAV